MAWFTRDKPSLKQGEGEKRDGGDEEGGEDQRDVDSEDQWPSRGRTVG